MTWLNANFPGTAYNLTRHKSEHNVEKRFFPFQALVWPESAEQRKHMLRDRILTKNYRNGKKEHN